MGQPEVIEFLKKQPNKWFKLSEIRLGLGLAESGCSNVLRRLRESRLIKFELKEARANIQGHRHVWHYQYKKV